MKKIAFLVAPEGTERVELTEPWDAVVDAGHSPVLLSTAQGHAQTFDHSTRSEQLRGRRRSRVGDALDEL